MATNRTVPLRKSVPAMLLGCCLMLAGCSQQAAVVMMATASGQRLQEPFDSAYVAIGSAGSDEVILVHDPLVEAKVPAPGQPLYATHNALIHQVLQVRLLYRPMEGARGDSPAARNAALHWTVFTDSLSGGGGSIDYSGTGFASIQIQGKDADVIIRNARLSIDAQHGQLVDPLRSFTINAHFHAMVDNAAAQSVLQQLRP